MMYVACVFIASALIVSTTSLLHPKPSFPTDVHDPKTNLDYFVRVIGSKDPNESSVNYMNASIFAKQPGKRLQKLFNFEGYNINRKISQTDGSYLSLSREFVVYRDLHTHAILNVWMNPWTSKPNEIFFVANDPVNAHLELGPITPVVVIPGKTLVFNSDILLEYPNALDPSVYPQYSSGPVYEAAELFGYFASLVRLRYGDEVSVPMLSTWIRRCQYLPWMEMSTAQGELYYTTFSWKCKYEGLECVASDIMKIINERYPEYKEAPSEEEIPNKTSWTAFKSVIDQRRKGGFPDIIIPTSVVARNVTLFDTFVDKRITDFFLQVRHMMVRFTGTAWSQITGKRSLSLFNTEGVVFPKVTESIDGIYTVSVTGSISFRNVKSDKRLTFWRNPLTGAVNFVPNPVTFRNKVFSFPKDFVYSMEISRHAIGLLAAHSEDNGLNKDVWSVNILDIIFDRTTFGRHSEVFFYGTAGRFSNWLDWMKMGNMSGNLVFKVTFYRD